MEIKSDIVIHTPTLEECNVVLKILEREGINWYSGDKSTSLSCGYSYRENSCIHITSRHSCGICIEQSSRSYFEKIGSHIISAASFISEHLDKWQILTTPENVEIVGTWFNSQYSSDVHCHDYCSYSEFFPYCAWPAQSGHLQEEPLPNYITLTFEEFKSIILQKPTMETTTLITGSEALLEALLKETGCTHCTDWKPTAITIRDGIVISHGQPKWLIITTTTPHHLVLPKDWDEAIEAIKSHSSPKAIPVEDIKVGDFVVVLPSDPFYYNCEQEKAQVVLQEADEDGEVLLGFENGDERYYTQMRRATKEETDFLGEIQTVNGYQLKMTDTDISYGCQYFDKEDLLALQRSLTRFRRMKDYDPTMTSEGILFGDKLVSLKHISALISTLK